MPFDASKKNFESLRSVPTSNFMDWQANFEAAAKLHGVWRSIQGRLIEPEFADPNAPTAAETKEHDEWEDKQEQAAAMLWLCIDLDQQTQACVVTACLFGTDCDDAVQLRTLPRSTVFAICGNTNALFIWAFYPETTGRRLEEMDALFADAPLFVPGTPYARVGDRLAAERELRSGMVRPGEVTEHAKRSSGAVGDEEAQEERKESTEKIE
ncbi:MFS domain-containing protein [Mycena chlorophos]|uniref:MFS domain-containing protein n=1 Tax=Mycena chlorophos TaxID=658473 RepID=A0A8H6SSJ8_MYCCL|nr:MFS domain-containing protein [Mycena chlorophos]